MDFMKEVLRGRPDEDFKLPEGVVRVNMDAESGLLAAEDCPYAVAAVFKNGTQPKQYCKHGAPRLLGGQGGDGAKRDSRLLAYPE
jgi:membrane carboxypeptidase/penicillin-binding protein